MSGFLAFFVTPALVSLLVTLWAGRLMEATRARRDHITKLFEVTREDVRRAIEHSVDYFATEPEKRSALQEAKIVLAERELRSAMPILLGPHPELKNDDREIAQTKFEDLMAELTGGNFQVVAGDVDLEHIRRLTHAGSGLRSSLAKMRDAELRMLVSDDPLQRGWRALREWFTGDGRYRLPKR